LTPGAKKYADEDRAAGARWEDIAFLLASFAIVVLPAWLTSGCPGDTAVRRATLEPVRIDVNRAPWYEWTLLDGIGEVRARRLVEYRDENGPFRSLEDLERIPDMPGGWVDSARPQLEIRGSP
jgi:competence protein ComEA